MTGKPWTNVFQHRNAKITLRTEKGTGDSELQFQLVATGVLS
jgi:hypothetical protein